jgi:hypothetical protein
MKHYTIDKLEDFLVSHSRKPAGAPNQLADQNTPSLIIARACSIIYGMKLKVEFFSRKIEMNVIEEYVRQVQALNLDVSLFDPEGTQICPAEGTRRLNEFAEGCKSWFSYIDHIICTQLICKTWKNNGVEELQGVAAFNSY